MPSRGKARLDQALLQKISDRTGKTPKYIREQVSKRASRLSIASEAALILWARGLGFGTATAFRKLEPHLQEQVRSALPTAFADKDTAQKRTHRQKKTRTVDSVGMAIDYLLSDDELRDRCRDLLRKRRHFDRVLREATTVLEHRVRQLSGLGPTNPEELVNKALNPDPKRAILVVSRVSSEQQGFHSICRGIVLAFRHKAHHQLDDKVTREDALKFCSFVDVLLGILAKARQHTIEPKQ